MQDTEALSKRIDKFILSLFIATDEYLSSSASSMEQPIPIVVDKPVDKPAKKSTNQSKKVLQKKKKTPPTSIKNVQQSAPPVTKIDIPIIQKAPTPIPIVQKSATPVTKIDIPQIELVTSPIKRVPQATIEKMMDDIDMEITLLNQLGEKYPDLEWPRNSSFVQLVLTSVIDKYDHPFVYDIKYDGIFSDDVVKDTNGISLALYEGVTEDYNSFPIDYASLGNQLKKLQDNDIICIPVYFTIIEENGVTEQHSNLLIYRPKQNRVDHFEAHGPVYYSKLEYFEEFNRYIDEGMKKLWEEQLTKYIGKVKYISRDVTCPMREGLQVLSGGQYCALITIFMADMCLKNPTVSTAEIINKVYEISKKDPAYIKRILNGYIVTAFKDVKTYTDGVYMHLSKNEQKSFDFLKQQIGDTPISKSTTPKKQKSK
jgi:hypothetical protein